MTRTEILTLTVAIASMALPASVSAQWRGARPHHRPAHPAHAPDALWVPYDAQVVDVTNQRHLRRVAFVPPTVRRVVLRGTSIRRLPALPASVEYLDISRTPIRHLGALPPNLRVLRARNGQLRHVGYLPPSLRRIDLAGSQVRSLPNLPAGLVELNVSRTPITALPRVPNGLRELRANGTQLRVSWLPRSLVVCEIPYPPPAARPARRAYRYRWGRAVRRATVRRRVAPRVTTPRWERYRRQRAF